MSLIQNHSGQIFAEDFSNSKLNSALWTFWPNQSGRYDLTAEPGKIIIKHGEPDSILYLNHNLPDTFMIEMIMSHNAILSQDQAGFIVRDNSGGYLELLDEVRPNQPACQGLRLTRNFDRWEGYYLANNIWNHIGCVMLNEVSQLGIILKGKNDIDMMSLVIDKIVMSTGAGISLTGIPSDWKVSLSSSDNSFEALADNGDIFIVTRSVSMPFTGNLVVKDNSNTVIFELSSVFWPGDAFVNEQRHQIRAYINDESVNASTPTDLGHLVDNELITEIVIENYGTTDLNNIYVSATQIIDCSYKWITFANYNPENQAVGEFVEKLLIDYLPAGGMSYVKIKVKRPNTFFAITGTDLKFMICIGW